MVCLMRRVESPAVFLTELHLPSTTYGAPLTEQQKKPRFNQLVRLRLSIKEDEIGKKRRSFMPREPQRGNCINLFV